MISIAYVYTSFSSVFWKHGVLISQQYKNTWIMTVAIKIKHKYIFLFQLNFRHDISYVKWKCKCYCFGQIHVGVLSIKTLLQPSFAHVTCQLVCISTCFVYTLGKQQQAWTMCYFSLLDKFYFLYFFNGRFITNGLIWSYSCILQPFYIFFSKIRLMAEMDFNTLYKSMLHNGSKQTTHY